MDLRSLECFISVAEEGSVSRAAVRLHMSQPPLSVRLQALERELGVALLVRHGRGVDLTAPGRVLLERGRRLLAELDATRSAVRAVADGAQGRLTVALGRSVSPALVSQVLAGVVEQADALSVEVVELPDAEVLDRVRGGSADAGLVHLPPERLAPGRARAAPDPERGYELAVVTREPLLAVLPGTHPLAGNERVDLADLAGTTLVTLSRAASPALHEHALAAWSASTAAPPLVLEIGSTTAALSLLGAGLGVAVLPASVRDLLWTGLVALPLRQHAALAVTAVAWRTTDDLPVLRRFLRVALATPEPDVLGPAVSRR